MSNQYNNMVQWYYGGSYPRYWQLEVSSDNTPSWSVYSLLSGDITPEPVWIPYDALNDGSENTYFRVIGVPYSGAATSICKTSYSNTITSSKPSQSGNTPTLTQVSDSGISFVYGQGMRTGYYKKNAGSWVGTDDGTVLIGVAGDVFSGFCATPGYANSSLTGITLTSEVPPPNSPTLDDYGNYNNSAYELYHLVWGEGATGASVSVDNGLSWQPADNGGEVIVNNNDTVYAYCFNEGGNSATISLLNVTICPDPVFSDPSSNGNIFLTRYSPSTSVMCFDGATWTQQLAPIYEFGYIDRDVTLYAYSLAVGFRDSTTVDYTVHYKVGTPILTDVGSGMVNFVWGEGATAGYYNVNDGSWTYVGNGGDVGAFLHNDIVKGYCSRADNPNSDEASVQLYKKLSTPSASDNHDGTATINWTDIGASQINFSVNGGMENYSYDNPKTVDSLVDGDVLNTYVSQSQWESSDTASVTIQTRPNPPDLVDNNDGTVTVNWGFLADAGYIGVNTNLSWISVANGGSEGGFSPGYYAYGYSTRVGYADSVQSVIGPVSVKCGTPTITDFNNGTVGIDIGTNGETTTYQIQGGGWGYITTYSEFGVVDGDLVEAYTYDNDSVYLNSDINSINIVVVATDSPVLTDNHDGSVGVERGANAERTYYQINSLGWSYDDNATFNITSLNDNDLVEAYCTATGLTESATVNVTVAIVTNPPALTLQATNTGLVQFDFGSGALWGYYKINLGGWNSIAHGETFAVINGDWAYGYCGGAGDDSSVASLQISGLAPDAPTLYWSADYAYWSGNTGSETVMYQVDGAGFSDGGNMNSTYVGSGTFLIEAYSTHVGWDNSATVSVWAY